MSRRFAEITFTPSVQAAQSRYGSRMNYQGMEDHDQSPDRIGTIEKSFIEARDGFYQATVNADGWPYVQYRGGPAGFLKVLDDRTIGYADYRGNVQYISVGNVADNDRISLILMDYPNRRRLKIWARVKLVHYNDHAALIDQLEIPTYRAQIERAFILKVEAMDWNCPQHIVPRYNDDQIDEIIQPLLKKIHQLEQTSHAPVIDNEFLGDGDLKLTVRSVRQLSPNIRAYEFSAPDHSDLPEFVAGSNLEIPVHLPNGEVIKRYYSISSASNQRGTFEIAVKREEQGRGGSLAIHQGYVVGMNIRARLISNRFRPHQDNRPTVFIAGGIGITPIKSMALDLWAKSREFHLHYAAISRVEAAFYNDLHHTFRDHVSFYFSDENKRLNIKSILQKAKDNAVFYICGPQRLIQDVRDLANDFGITPDRIVFENFQATAPKPYDTAFSVKLARSNREIMVPKDSTILEALLDANIEAAHACKTGGCGTCATKVLDGTPDHRDNALSQEEREQAGLICTCVSRAHGNHLTLDL